MSRKQRCGGKIVSGPIIGQIFQRPSGPGGNNTVAYQAGRPLAGRQFRNPGGYCCLRGGVSADRAFHDNAVADKECAVVLENLPDVLPGLIEWGECLIAVDCILSGIIGRQGKTEIVIEKGEKILEITDSTFDVIPGVEDV